MSRNVINESHVLNEASCGVPTDLDKLENVKLDTKGVKYVQGVNSVELSKSDSVNQCQNGKTLRIGCISLVPMGPVLTGHHPMGSHGSPWIPMGPWGLPGKFLFDS